MKMRILAALLAATVSQAVMAANYTFDVIYSGDNSAVLAAGSDDPLSVTMGLGDSFTYRLTAAGNGSWRTIADGSVFPAFALSGNWGGFDLTYSFDLNANGVSAFSRQATEGGCCAHLGTNSVDLIAGLNWNQYALTATINSVSQSSSANSLLPWPGVGPENWSPGVIAYDAGVPEPASWAMMIGGFGLLGATARRRRVATVAA